jgi:hypothetical protein
MLNIPSSSQRRREARLQNFATGWTLINLNNLDLFFTYEIRSQNLRYTLQEYYFDNF